MWMSRGGQVTNPTRQQTGIRPDLFRNPIFRSIFVAGALAEVLKIIGFKPVLSCFDQSQCEHRSQNRPSCCSCGLIGASGSPKFNRPTHFLSLIEGLNLKLYDVRQSCQN